MTALEQATFDDVRAERDHLQAENAALVAALREAIELVQLWQSMGLTGTHAAQVRRDYEASPEMRRLRAVLAARAARTEGGKG